MFSGCICVPRPVTTNALKKTPGYTVFFKQEKPAAYPTYSFENDHFFVFFLGWLSKKEISELSITSIVNELYSYPKGDYQAIIVDKKNRKALFIQSPNAPYRLYYCWEPHKKKLLFSNSFALLRSSFNLGLSINYKKVIALFEDFPPTDTSSYYNEVLLVPNGSYLLWQNFKLKLENYWQPEKLNKIKYPKKPEYYEHFLSIMQHALKNTLKHYGNTLACELSGGLDSSTITALLSKLLAADRLTPTTLNAFGVIPHATPRFTNPRLNWNDRHLMNEVADSLKGVQLSFVTENDYVLTFEKSAEYAYNHAGGPCRNPFNLEWASTTAALAKETGSDILFTGRFGNHTISHPGRSFWKQLRHYLSHLGEDIGTSATPPLNKNKVEKLLPSNHPLPPLFSSYSKSLKKRVFDRSIAFADFDGALGETYNIACYDVTASQEILEFCCQIPNSIFGDKRTDRKLIRKGMAGILPNNVLQNTRRGLQSALWLEELRKLSNYYLKKIKQWHDINDLKCLFNLNHMENLLEELQNESLFQQKLSYTQLNLRYRTQLARSLHIAEWISLHHQ